MICYGLISYSWSVISYSWSVRSYSISWSFSLYYCACTASSYSYCPDRYHMRVGIQYMVEYLYLLVYIY